MNKQEIIEKLVDNFLQDRNHNDRYSSFDFCYNYFYSFYKEDKIKELGNKNNLENSCHQLGFYLASWGMMRGSSFLLKKSISHFQNLIKRISKMPKEYWEIDLDNYTEENIIKLLKIKLIIIEELGENNNPSDTLVTKIMLGVFGNIPAFDRYFKKGLGIGKINKNNLYKINEFYFQNKNVIDSFKINTLNFNDGKDTNIFYTKAKILDMYGFEYGYNKINN